MSGSKGTHATIGQSFKTNLNFIVYSVSTFKYSMASDLEINCMN